MELPKGKTLSLEKVLNSQPKGLALVGTDRSNDRNVAPTSQLNQARSKIVKFERLLSFLHLGGGSSIIAFLLMSGGFFYTAEEKFRRKFSEFADKVLIAICLCCSVYVMLTGLSFWGYQLDIPSEAGTRVAAKRGGGLVMLILRLWPYVCFFYGGFCIFAYGLEFRNLVVKQQKSD